MLENVDRFTAVVAAVVVLNGKVPTNVLLLKIKMKKMHDKHRSLFVFDM